MSTDDTTTPVSGEETDAADGEMYEVGCTDDGTLPSWSSLTVAALKTALVEKGLQTTGRKAELVARLEASNTDGGVGGAETELSADDHTAEDDREEIEKNGEMAAAADSKIEPDILCAVETGEADDDNDEFVEWNEGDDELKTSETDVLKVEVVDEVKVSESKDLEDKKEDVAKADGAPGEEHGKHEEEAGGELSVNIDKDKDTFYIIWQSKKITIPFKEDITKDLELYSRLQTVVMYPVTTSDLYLDVVRKQVEVASSIELTVEDTLPGKPPKGYLKLKFAEVPAAKSCLEELKDFREGVAVKHFTNDDSESHIMTKLRKEDCERKGPTLYRMLFVGNLPEGATEATLRDHFPEALQVFMPYNEDTSERLGYAYLEFANEKTAYEMADKSKETEIDGTKVYVIQAISEKKDKFGLIRDSLRLGWSEDIHRLRKIIDKPHGRPKWEISEAQQKVQVLERRLDRDKRRREVLHLPAPEFVPTKESEEKEREREEHSSERKDDRGSRDHHAARRDRRRSDYNRAAQQQQQQRGGNMQQNFPGRRDDVADKLVNQLQGLVSALTHKLPTVEPPRPLLEDLQFGPLANFQRSLAGAGFAAAGLRGPTGGYQSNYPAGGGGSGGVDNSQRYSSGKRYNDDDFGGDRKRRQGSYGESGSSGGRYGGGGGSSQGGNRQFNRPKY